MYRMVILVVVATTSLTVAGCGDSKRRRSTAAQRSGLSDSQAGNLPQGNEPVNLDPENFTTKIDNLYWPMVPGTRWTYRETDQEGAELQVVVTVTEETKQIANGITARVVRDTVTEDGKLVEDTFDWYAQDEQGNIWYMGEDTAEFENGKIKTKSGSFEAGVDGALPGIIMPGDPQPGMQYRQEYYKGEAEDNGEILSTRGDGRGALRPVRQRPPDQGHHHDRAQRTGVQALRAERRPRARRRRLGRTR